jgi:phycobilisome core-membrane linker protein
VEATQLRQGQLAMRDFIRALGRSKEYRRQFYGRFSNSRVVELAFRHFLGRGISSREEFTRYFDIVSAKGLNGLVDALVNSMEYARVFGEETVPYLRDLGEEAQESEAEHCVCVGRAVQFACAFLGGWCARRA